MGFRYKLVVVASLMYVFGYVTAASSTTLDKIALGAVFDQHTEEIQNAFKFAMQQHNENASVKRFELQAYVDVINTADAFKLSRLICNQFARGVFSMLGAVTPDSFETLHSYTNTFQMPFLSPWFPEKVIPPSSGLTDHAVSMRPDYHMAVVDTIAYYAWDSVIFLYDSHDGLLRLQQLYQTMRPGNSAFKISHVKRISNASEALGFLQSLEKLNRWSKKRVVLDCTTRVAKEVLVAHVRDVMLGRRTYHYLLSGLVMDDRWESEVVEFGAINITGFRMVDVSRKMVQDFMVGWKKTDTRGTETISAQAALMYDAVQVLIDTLSRLFRKKPDLLRGARRGIQHSANTTRVIDCNPAKSWITPFEHGEKISRLIKKTVLEGLTGDISFDEKGHRHNFTLHVMEMSVSNTMVKVATWSDERGLVASPVQNRRLQSPPDYDHNKTYIVSTVVEEPYLMWRQVQPGLILEGNDRFEGFCKDLADMLANRLDIKYELRPAKDGYYGSQDPEAEGGWNGMVGELLRKEADLAVASLTITPEREEVVDFSEPFLSLGVSIMIKRTTKYTLGVFSFLAPLSKETWICIALAIVAVGVVLFLISRISPNEWESVTADDTASDCSDDGISHMRKHKLSYWKSLWFSIGAFAQRASDIRPRSLSGRLVSCVWWFFTLALVSVYTANLTAFLTAEHLFAPVAAPLDITAQLQKYKSSSMSSTSNARTHVFVRTNDEDVRRMRQSQIKNAELVDTPKGDDINERLAWNNNLLGHNLYGKGFGIATPLGSPLRELINLAITSMTDEGELAKLTNKWWIESTEYTFGQLQEPQFSYELSLSNMAGLFYILIGGLTLSLLVAGLEFYHRRCDKSPKVRNDGEVLKTACTTSRSICNRGAGAEAGHPSHINEQQRHRNKNTPTAAPRANHPNAAADGERIAWNGSAYSGYYMTGSHLGQEVDTTQTSFTQV